MHITKKVFPKIAYITVLIGVIVVASAPAFRNGIYNGFDLWFHMGRIESIAKELSNGQFPVRYETGSWYGNGYISTVMYGNIFLYIPALLNMAGLATYRCYNLYVILVNAVGTGICFYSFYKLFKDKFWGLISTAMYMLAGYYISNIYMRAAVGEFTATIFIPLVVYGIYRIYFEETENNINKVLPLVSGTTGIIQSHVLTMVLLTLAILCFMLVYIKETIKNIKALLIAVVLVLGINCFFIVPFLDSYSSYVFTASVETVGVNIQKSGLYIGQILGLFPEGSGGRADWSSEGKEYLRIGIVHVTSFFMMTILILLKRKFSFKQEENKKFKAAVVVFFIGIVAAWMSSAYFPWGIFSSENVISNIMRGVQYPSRYLILQTICWNICGVYAFKTLGEHIEGKAQLIYKAVVVVLIGLFALVQTGIFMYTLSCRNLTVQTIEGHENIADGLYLRYGTDTENLLTQAEVVEGDAIVSDLGFNGRWREIKIENSSNDSAKILVPIFDYKYIHAYDGNDNELKMESTDNNQYALSVEEGFLDTIRVGFVEPILWRISEIITLLTIVLLTVKGCFEKNGNKNVNQ